VTIATPCTHDCTLNAAGNACAACGRTLEEIAGWAAMTNAAREAVMARLREARKYVLF